MSDPRDTFIRAAVWHGPLDDADGILVAHPELATADIHTAAILGDVAAVRRFLESDRALAVSKSPPLGWDALLAACARRRCGDPRHRAQFTGAGERAAGPGRRGARRIRRRRQSPGHSPASRSR